MLDYFCIFARGGALLWTFQLTALKGSPINSLVQNCLLEDRTGDKSYDYAPPQGSPYAMKWTLHNGLGLVFVAVYQKALSLLYVDALLERIKSEFEVEYKPDVYDYKHFNDTFKRVLRECESKADASRRQVTVRAFSSSTKKGDAKNFGSGQKSSKEDGNDEDSDKKGKENQVVAEAVEESNKGNVKSAEASGAFNKGELMKKIGGRGRGRGRGKTHKEHDLHKPEPSTQKKGKVNRHWDDAPGDAKKLDFSADGPETHVDVVDFGNDKSRMDEDDEDIEYSDEDVDFDPSEAEDKPGEKKSGVLSSFLRGLSVNVMGSNALTQEDIESALSGMKRKLMERNVAEEIAAKLCESVALNLEGQKMKSFTRVSTVVRQAFEDALVRILTPNRTINILAEIEKKKTKGKPYVIVFIGVNGVGKSTNLAKVAYWLLQNKHKVMIAACDTFRAGAVEQLRTHCQRLQVPLYERGYEKDPAKVAYEAARQAERDSCDVLLVDTAGRMQDNEPLMRALSSLINLNQPDLALFVGEALVGNDAVDQLTKFNQRLADLSTTAKPHLVDGIVLTKFDTIDEKVGAALSMVYTSGAPIMFVGCGQTYVDLKRLNVKSVVKSLLG